MNIKVKAGLEVAGFVASAIVVATLVRFGLDYLTTVYTNEQLLNGAAFTFTSAAAYFVVTLLYDIRVAKLEYKQKLEEMTKK